MPNDVKFALWLTKNREAVRLSIRGLAREAKVSHASISNYENTSGDPDIPKPKSIRKIADALGSTTAERERLYREGLVAAGHQSEIEDLRAEADDAVSTITREAGYDPAEIDESEMDQLRRGIRIYTRVWLEEKRKREGRDN